MGCHSITTKRAAIRHIRSRQPCVINTNSVFLKHLGSTAHATTETAERNCTLVVNDVLQVLLRLRQLHVLQSACCLSRVLEVSTQVATLGLQPNKGNDAQMQRYCGEPTRYSCQMQTAMSYPRCCYSAVHTTYQQCFEVKAFELQTKYCYHVTEELDVIVVSHGFVPQAPND
jgi:hypothetical protein